MEAKSLLIVMDCSCSCEQNVCFTQNDAKTTKKIRFQQNEAFKDDSGLDLQQAIIQRIMEAHSNENQETRHCKIEGVEVYSEHLNSFVPLVDFVQDAAKHKSVRAMRCSLVTTCIATSSKDDGNTAQSSSAMKCIRWRHFDIDGEEGMPFAGAVLRIREQVNQANTGTGLNLWDGAILLAKYLERFPETVSVMFVKYYY